MKSSLWVRWSGAFCVVASMGLSGAASAQAGQRLGLVQFKSDGTLDPGFGTSGAVVIDLPATSEERLTDVKATSTGTLVVSGFTKIGSTEDFLVGRFNSNGTPDTTFSGDGFATVSFNTSGDEEAYGVAERQGKVIVVGRALTTPPITSSMAVARFNSDGTPDASFGTGGTVTVAWPTGWSAEAEDVFVMPASGKILVAGTIRNQSLQETRIGVVRLNVNGTLDTTFSQDGMASHTFSGIAQTFGATIGVYAPFGESSGWIAIGGIALDNNVRKLAVGLLYPNGDDFTPFNANGRKVFGFPSNTIASASAALRTDSQGRIYMGCVIIEGSYRTFGIARLNSVGALDQTFDGDGVAKTASSPVDALLFSDLSVSPAGAIAAIGVGRVTSGNPSASNQVFTVQRFNVNGSPNTTFGSLGYRSYNPPLYNSAYVYAGAQLSSDAVVVVGSVYDPI